MTTGFSINKRKRRAGVVIAGPGTKDARRYCKNRQCFCNCDAGQGEAPLRLDAFSSPACLIGRLDSRSVTPFVFACCESKKPVKPLWQGHGTGFALHTCEK